MDYFRLCTNRTDSELASIERRLKKENPRDIKAELARDVITLYHSAQDAERAQQEFDKVFRDKGVPQEMPEFKVPPAGQNIIALAVEAGLLPSKSEARRKLAEGAFYLDSDRVTDPDLVVKVESAPRILKVGKRRFLRLVRG